MDIFLEQVKEKDLGRIIYDADLSKYTTYMCFCELRV